MLSEVADWIDCGLAAAPDAPAELRATAVCMAVGAAALIGDHTTAAARADEAVRVAQSTGDTFLLARAYYSVSQAADLRGDGAAAVAPCREAVRLFRQTRSDLWISWSLAELGDKLAWLGQLDEAVPMLDEALELSARVGLHWGVAMISGQRAQAARLQGDQALACRLFAESINGARIVKDRRMELGAVVGLAGVALAVGDSVRAARLLGAAEAARDSTGVGSISHVLHSTRIVDEVRSSLDPAAFAAAWADGQRRTVDETVAAALTLAGEIMAGAGQPM